jgi:hypothetical protein
VCTIRLGKPRHTRNVYHSNIVLSWYIDYRLLSNLPPEKLHNKTKKFSDSSVLGILWRIRWWQKLLRMRGAKACLVSTRPAQ